jgi:serine/threonine-protein kinase
MNGEDNKRPGAEDVPEDDGRTRFIPSSNTQDGGEEQSGDEVTSSPVPKDVTTQPDAVDWSSHSEEADSAKGGAAAPESAGSPVEPGGDAAGEDEKTRWMPSATAQEEEGKWTDASGDSWQPPAPAAPSAPTRHPGETTGNAAISTSFAPSQAARSIEIGDVLNHIFEVKRFIASGGMGKVFEGINVNSEERVAIKVMLPQLAADTNVISMFRKEARTLTKLHHEALVQYRVLAQEPQLGVLYIVTEYVDGTNLSDELGKIDPTPEELTGLLRRLASGLRAAHALNAIHRDISPDNVLLEGGSVAGAKIIDFGIAKNLDPGSATIIGEGFAGKLSYVAPEQLGDFGRNVGTWTDVYSLALVILAVAKGRNVEMGGSLVDAVDKRRAGVDLSGAPESLRPVLAKMLEPNPADRLQTMDQVLAEIDRAEAPPAPPPAPRVPPLWLAGGVGAVLLAIVGGWLVLSGRAESGGAAPGGANAPVAQRDPMAAARSVIDSALPSVSCTWLEIVDVHPGGDGSPAVSFAGVAGNPAAAQGQLGRALEGAGVKGASLDFDEVAPITPAGCAALDGFRLIRQPESGGISVPQRKFERKLQPAGTDYAGQLAANAVIDLRTADVPDFTIVGIEPSGILTQSIESRAQLDQFIGQNPNTPIHKTTDGYRLQIDSDHDGWTGLVLITGKPPFDPALVAPPLGGRGPDWQAKFVSTAAERGWKAEMVWYKLVDEVPN